MLANQVNKSTDREKKINILKIRYRNLVKNFNYSKKIKDVYYDDPKKK